MYRKSALLNIPFEEVAFGEDMLWAKSALNFGYKIIYTPFANVYHYHMETKEYTFRRFLISYYFTYEFFDIKPQINQSFFIGLMKIAKSLALMSNIPFWRKLHWFVYNYRTRKAERKAIQLMNSTDNKAELQSLFNKHCGDVPQAPKPLISYE